MCSSERRNSNRVDLGRVLPQSARLGRSNYVDLQWSVLAVRARLLTLGSVSQEIGCDIEPKPEFSILASGFASKTVVVRINFWAKP